MLLSASGAVIYALVSVHVEHILSINSDNVQQYVVELTALLNKPYSSLLCDNSDVRYCVKIINSSVM